MIEVLLLDASDVDVPLSDPGTVLGVTELERYQTFGCDARRREFLLGRFLLKAALTGGNINNARNFGAIDTAVSIGGKPAVSGAQFNLSHDKDAILLAIGDQSVGVDIETVQKFDHAMMETCFTTDDRRRIACSPHPDRTATLLWCMTEASSKAAGTGLLPEIGKSRNRKLFFRGGFLTVAGILRAYAVCSLSPISPFTITPALPKFREALNLVLKDGKQAGLNMS